MCKPTPACVYDGRHCDCHCDARSLCMSADQPPLDPRQQCLPGVDQPSEAAAAAIEAIDVARRDAELQREHDLVRVRAPVYVLDQEAARRRSGSAERMARKRARDRQADEAAGLAQVSAKVPHDLAAKIEAAGGLSAWLETNRPAPVQAEPRVEIREVVREVRVEVPGPERIVEKPVPVKLSGTNADAYRMGKRIEAARGWRRRVLLALLPPAPRRR